VEAHEYGAGARSDGAVLMVWDRRQIGPGENLSQLKAHLEGDFEALQFELVRLGNIVDELTRLAVLNGVVLIFQFDDNQDTGSAPPAGFFRANAANVVQATEIAVSDTDVYQRGQIGGQLLRVGDLVTLAAADLSAALIYRVTTLPTDLGPGFSFGVAFEDGTAYNPGQDEFVRLSWRPSDLIGARQMGV